MARDLTVYDPHINRLVEEPEGSATWQRLCKLAWSRKRHNLHLIRVDPEMVQPFIYGESDGTFSIRKVAHYGGNEPEPIGQWWNDSREIEENRFQFFYQSYYIFPQTSVVSVYYQVRRTGVMEQSLYYCLSDEEIKVHIRPTHPTLARMMLDKWYINRWF